MGNKSAVEVVGVDVWRKGWVAVGVARGIVNWVRSYQSIHDVLGVGLVG